VILFGLVVIRTYIQTIWSKLIYN